MGVGAGDEGLSTVDVDQDQMWALESWAPTVHPRTS